MEVAMVLAVLTRSPAVTETQSDASCLSVVSFNNTIHQVLSFIIGDFSFRFTIKFCSVLFGVVVHADCDKQDSVMRGGLCDKQTPR